MAGPRGHGMTANVIGHQWSLTSLFSRIPYSSNVNTDDTGDDGECELLITPHDMTMIQPWC